jgi:hypothetical protein
MKSQSRSMGISRIFGRRARNEAVNTNTADVSNVADNTRTNMQSLAAELQQSAQQGEFQYPRNWTLVVNTFSALLVMLSLAHAGLVLIPMVTAQGNSLTSLLNWATLGVVLGIAGASVVAAFLTNLFPTIQVTPQGLGVAEAMGWRYIPWKQISVLRVMEVRNHKRYVVLIPFTGKTKPATPAPMLGWLPALLGASGRGGHGVVITSDMKNFDRLLQLVVSYLVQTSGQNPNSVPLEAYVDEDSVMPIAQLFLDPDAEIVRVAASSNSKSDLYSVSSEETDVPVAWLPVLRRQLLITLVPAFLLLSDVLMRHNERPFVWQHAAWVLFMVALGMAELPFVGMLVRAVGELMVGSGQFSRAIWAYLELQVPRAILIMVGAALVGLGLPAFVAEALWFAGIVLTTFLTVRFVQRLYYMPLSHTLLAAMGTFIFQFLSLALYFGVR